VVDFYPLNLTEVMLPVFACFCRNFMCLFFEKTVNFVKRRFFVKMRSFSPFRGRGGFWAKRGVFGGFWGFSLFFHVK
jgi:hypothetical protein